MDDSIYTKRKVMILSIVGVIVVGIIGIIVYNIMKQGKSQICEKSFTLSSGEEVVNKIDIKKDGTVDFIYSFEKKNGLDKNSVKVLIASWMQEEEFVSEENLTTLEEDNNIIIKYSLNTNDLKEDDEEYSINDLRKELEGSGYKCK